MTTTVTSGTLLHICSSETDTLTINVSRMTGMLLVYYGYSKQIMK